MAESNQLIVVGHHGDIHRRAARGTSRHDLEEIRELMPLRELISVRKFTACEPAIPKNLALQGQAKGLSLYDAIGVGSVKESVEDQLLGFEESVVWRDHRDPVAGELCMGVYEEVYPRQGKFSPFQSGFVFVVGHQVPRNRYQEFNAWYDTEHLPLALATPGVVSGRRFKRKRGTLDGGRGLTFPVFLTVYEFETQRVLENEAFWKAGATPWTAWVRTWSNRKMFMLYALEEIWGGR